MPVGNQRASRPSFCPALQVRSILQLPVRMPAALDSVEQVVVVALFEFLPVGGSPAEQRAMFLAGLVSDLALFSALGEVAYLGTVFQIVEIRAFGLFLSRRVPLGPGPVFLTVDPIPFPGRLAVGEEAGFAAMLDFRAVGGHAHLARALECAVGEALFDGLGVGGQQSQTDERSKGGHDARQVIEAKRQTNPTGRSTTSLAHCGAKRGWRLRWLVGRGCYFCPSRTASK